MIAILQIYIIYTYLILQGSNDLTKQLLDKLMARCRIYVVPGSYRGKILIRFAVCSRFTIEEDILFAWSEISHQASEVLQANLKLIEITNKFDITPKKSGLLSRMKEHEMKNKEQHSTFMIK